MVYRYHPSVGIFMMALGAIVMVLAFVCLFVSEADSETARVFGFACCLGLGLLFETAGYVTWAQQVAVDSKGLPGRFAWFHWNVPWASLRYWVVYIERHGEYKGSRCAKFFLDEKEVAAVWEWEAYPGFQTFLDEVRSHAGSKERVTEETLT